MKRTFVLVVAFLAMLVLASCRVVKRRCGKSGCPGENRKGSGKGS